MRLPAYLEIASSVNHCRSRYIANDLMIFKYFSWGSKSAKKLYIWPTGEDTAWAGMRQCFRHEREWVRVLTPLLLILASFSCTSYSWLWLQWLDLCQLLTNTNWLPCFLCSRAQPGQLCEFGQCLKLWVVAFCLYFWQLHWSFLYLYLSKNF